MPGRWPGWPQGPLQRSASQTQNFQSWSAGMPLAPAEPRETAMQLAVHGEWGEWTLGLGASRLPWNMLQNVFACSISAAKSWKRKITVPGCPCLMCSTVSHVMPSLWWKYQTPMKYLTWCFMPSQPVPSQMKYWTHNIQAEEQKQLQGTLQAVLESDHLRIRTLWAETCEHLCGDCWSQRPHPPPNHYPEQPWYSTVTYLSKKVDSTSNHQGWDGSTKHCKHHNGTNVLEKVSLQHKTIIIIKDNT